MSAKIRVAVVGLEFGAEFVPIYLDHPDVEAVSICDSNPARLRRACERPTATTARISTSSTSSSGA